MVIARCSCFSFQLYPTICYITPVKNTQQRLVNIFNTLLESFGRRNWWPGETELEIIVGAVLTQNTSWKNVEKAIDNLKQHNALDIETLYKMDKKTLALIIKSSGFYNIKSNRLKNLINVIYDDYLSNISNLKMLSVLEVRNRLLAVNGIGKETADSIILYALNKPIFVIDVYTKRFLKNHRIYDGQNDYDAIQDFFMRNLPENTYLFNEFHALIVYLCQNFCKKMPLCNKCPLEKDII
jgi:endonuclease III related protein